VGALIAGDAVDPEDVAAGVDLDVEAFGRRPEPDLRVVEASVGGEAEAAKREVSGREEAAVAGAVVGAKGADVGASSTASYSHGELAAHLEDAGGGRALHQQREEKDEEHREEDGSAGRWRHRSDRALGFA